MKGIALAALLVAVVAVAIRWNSWVAGGSDSYCYVYQAERWAAVLRQLGSGRAPVLQTPNPLAIDAPWPDGARAFAPAGHLPSPTVPGAIVPVCPSGLSMAMAPVVAIGGSHAAFAVLPVFGALLIWATYRVGSRFGAHVGMASALLTAASPVFLYQLVQPMSDVPSAALWMTALAAATGTSRSLAITSGAATSAAILMRPNLVPLGVVIGVFLLFRSERTRQWRLRAAATYAITCIPGCVAVALIQQAFYGSPFSSGYGSLAALFSTEHVAPNLRRYGEWLWQTQTPVVALAALAPWLLPGALAWMLVAMVLVNVALYVPYVVFEDWSFLRFLLPTLPVLCILVIAVIDAVLGRLHIPMRRVIVPLAALALMVPGIQQANARSAFRLQRLESRFARAGTYVGSHLPERALVITSWESGSVRFYGQRPTMVWDQLPTDGLDRAIAFVRERGYEPYMLFERWEEPLFRERFGEHNLAALDWPPMAEIGAQVRIYKPEDRARYFQGTAAPTEYVP